ncbi:hypothetical protein [Halobaculum lipolyticum]|uniref:Uncharacterized protein n=1 Tax=Halobaculum lipolyticum TaxID=3032001 RepID=A0ABD5WE52_9EURY|nr:hypothetical protein [Halobaculum sp. DT31]
MYAALTEVADSPEKLGAVLGLLVGVVQRFVYPVGFPAVTVVVVGVVLTRFGGREWVDVGRTFVVLGAAVVVVSAVLRLVFGGPLV